MNSQKQTAARIKVTSAMIIYGTIGLFVKSIPFPSPVTAMFRGLIGAPFLFLVMLFMKKRPDLSAIKRNGLLIGLSGIMLSLNWILLFSAYNYTSVATATLCYYMAPVFIVILSPFFFGEKITLKKGICIFAALVGMVFVSGAAENGISSAAELKGVFLGIAAAVLYALIISANKKITDISPYDRTIAQLLISAIILIPFNLLSGSFSGLEFSTKTTLLVIFIGIVHTGFAYYLYFGSTAFLPAQSLAILSYIDPVLAVLLSALILKEELTLFTLIGAVLILGAALISELGGKNETGPVES
ncbi:MAG: DMT family transporter [Oscillospiraceae bacterium]|nr:DMT family transporter [Oscillospiraceae bacterium]